MAQDPAGTTVPSHRLVANTTVGSAQRSRYKSSTWEDSRWIQCHQLPCSDISLENLSRCMGRIRQSGLGLAAYVAVLPKVSDHPLTA
jgi:hypothetical protein